MAVRPAQHQAIAFTTLGQTDFNNLTVCQCPTSDNDWQYPIKPGDVTPIQFINDCEGIEYGAELVSNGGFEQGDAEESITDWTIFNENTELTEVSRSTNDPFAGNYSAYWEKTNNTASTSTLTQDTGNTFLAGETYLLELYARILNNHGGCGISENLIVTVGGIEIKLTPQDNYEKFSVYITFDTNGSDGNIILAIDDFNCKDTLFMWVDNVSLKKLLSTDQCGDCSPDILFNGDFEDGQRFEVVPDVATIEATFDGWLIVDGSVTEDLTGGPDGDRCMVLSQDGTGDGTAESNQVLLNARDYILTFFAKSNAPTDTLEVFLTITGTTEVFNLTDQYQQFTYLFTATTDDRIQFINDATTSISLDDVNLFFNPPNDNTLYIVDVTNDDTYPIPDSMIEDFVGGFNVNLDYNEIFGDTFPECFKVCLEPCAGDVMLNGTFEEGEGTTFTDWSNEVTAPGTVTEAKLSNLILQSQTFDDSDWDKINGGTGLVPVVTADLVEAPDGTMTADRIVFNSGGGTAGTDFSIMQQNPTTTAAQNYTGSIWLKGAVGGEQILFRHVAGMNFTVLTLTNQWVRYSLTEASSGGSYQFGIRQAVSGPINATATVYAWGAQLELGALTSRYVPTVGSIVTIDNGIEDSRAPQLNTNADTGVASIEQTGLSIGVAYVLNVWAKKVIGVSNTFLDINDGTTLRNYASQLLTANFQRYTFEFVATTADLRFTIDETISGVTALVIDNVSLFPAEGYQPYCSEQFKSVDSEDCSRELVWYSNDNAFGINYESGFRNVMRVPGQGDGCKISNPSYPTEMTKTLNGSVTEISKATIRKEVQMTMSLVPEFIHDRLAIMVRHTNIELGGVGYAPVDETVYTVIPDENGKCLLTSQVVLGIKGEILAEKTTEC